jgi:hypothetical protein
MRHWTYNYGTGNVGSKDGMRLLGTLEHVQECDSYKSYYLFRPNNYKSGMPLNEQLQALYKGNVGFTAIEYAFEYLDTLFKE